MQQLVTDLKSLLGAPRAQPQEPREVVARQPKYPALAEWISHHWPKVSAGGLAILAIIAIWQYWPLSNQESSMRVAEMSEERAEATPVPRLESLSVRASRRTLKPAETLKLTVEGRYSDGSEREVNDGIKWSSSDAGVAMVNEDGEVRALRSGTTDIVAKIGAVASSTWTLGVEAAKTAAKPAVPRLVALKISSDKKELFENEKIALRARAKYSDDSERHLSGGITWQSSDRAVASINSKGELRALRPGKVEIIARAQNLSSAAETFLVRAAAKKEAPRAKPVATAEPAAAKRAAFTAQAKAKIAGHLDRAQAYREQGNYAAALAELEQAKTLDSGSEEIRQEIEKTRRACNAEKVLGNTPNC